MLFYFIQSFLICNVQFTDSGILFLEMCLVNLMWLVKDTGLDSWVLFSVFVFTEL